jgi:hypothetical protein
MGNRKQRKAKARKEKAEAQYLVAKAELTALKVKMTDSRLIWADEEPKIQSAPRLSYF